MPKGELLKHAAENQFKRIGSAAVAGIDAANEWMAAIVYAGIERQTLQERVEGFDDVVLR